VDGSLWPCWSWNGKKKLWSGKHKTTGHGSLIIANLLGRVIFISDPVTGNQHDMRKLKGSDAEKILKKAAGAFGDKGFIGTDYITTPIRKPKSRKLLEWEKEWNRQVSSFRAPAAFGKKCVSQTPGAQSWESPGTCQDRLRSPCGISCAAT
jgi:DDE superfamily endonuclease